MRNIFIYCESEKQSDDVFFVLENMKGLKPFYENNKDSFNVLVNPDNYFFTRKLPLITTRYTMHYSKFMELYAVQPLKSKIEQAKQELNISTSELSRRMGYSRNYVSNMVSNGCTTKKQQEMISIIDSILGGEIIKTDKQVIAELSEKLDESQSNVNRLLNEVRDITIKSGEVAELNLKLSNDIETCHESLQNRSDRILNLEDELTYLNKQNTLQNDSMIKQQLLNQDLNAENIILKKQRVDDAKRYSMIIAVLTMIIIILGVMCVY